MTSSGLISEPSPASVGPDRSSADPGRSSAARPSAARARILATAGRLFYGTGIRSVGVDRVIAESQVARMTFFRHFPTKDHLVVAFLEARAADGCAELLRARDDQGPRGVLAWVLEGVRTVPTSEGFRGCEFINTAAEFCDPGHPARAVAERHRAWIRDRLSDALAELGHPTPCSTAELLLVLRTGAIVATSLEGLDDVESFERAWWSLVDGPPAASSAPR